MMFGFLEGYTLERVGIVITPLFMLMRHIFTGPSTAYGGQSRGTRPCNAVLHHVTTVEAAHIAYGCVQVCLHPCHS
jgi:hypothetical protein